MFVNEMPSWYSWWCHYHKTSNIRAPNPKTSVILVSSCSCFRPIHWSQVLSWEWRCWKGDAPTTSEWSTILLPTKAHLVLEVWRYMEMLSTLLALCEGNPWVTGGFPSWMSSNADLWYSLCFSPQQIVEQTVELLVLEMPYYSWILCNMCH